MDCPFCPPAVLGRIIAESRLVVAMDDQSPVTPGHCLVIPRRHVASPFSLSARELLASAALLGRLRDRLLAGGTGITGFNVAANSGASAGQTVAHAHIHLIPRRDGDMADPRDWVDPAFGLRLKGRKRSI